MNALLCSRLSCTQRSVRCIEIGQLWNETARRSVNETTLMKNTLATERRRAWIDTEDDDDVDDNGNVDDTCVVADTLSNVTPK